MHLAAVLLWVSPVFALPLQLDSRGDVADASIAANTSPAAVAATSDSAHDGEPQQGDVGAQMARRARVGRTHRALGLATWSAMTLSVVSGIVQYRNLYGFFSPLERTPCVTGDVHFTRSCSGAPIFHATTTALATGLYVTTLGFSIAMPDPLGLDRGSSDSARRLRRHKRLRWVHLSGMIAQALLGSFIANSQAFGIDRTNDFRLLQGLATAHMAIGLTTYGALTWAGGTMVGEH